MATLTQTETEGVTVLRVEGGLTHDGVGAVGAAFEAATGSRRGRPGAPKALAEGARVLIDLSEVPVLTTPGLSLLLVAARQVEKGGGRLVITGTRGLVYDVLRRCRLDAVLNIVQDPQEALRRAQD